MLILSYALSNILKTRFSCGLSHIVGDVTKKESSGVDVDDDDTFWEVWRLYVFTLGFPAAADVVAFPVEGGSAT